MSDIFKTKKKKQKIFYKISNALNIV